MCAPNKINNGKIAFSYLFRTHCCTDRTHLAITISAMVSGHLGTISRVEVFVHQT